MKKMLSAVLLAVLIFNSIFYYAEASNKKIFDEIEAEGSLIEILLEDPNLMLQQYSNILSVETMALSNADCSNGEIVKAYERDQDGTVSLLEVEATLTKILYQEKVDLSFEGDEMPVTLYALTANTVSEDSKTIYGVSLSGTIIWKDNFLVDNELVSMSGERSGSYTGDGKYYCMAGSRYVGPGWGYFSGTSFVDSSVAGEKGQKFQLNVYSSSTNSTKEIVLIVKTSIFD